MSSKLWGGRFSKPADALFEQFSQSLSYDWKLAAYDIEGSMAHARMLAKCRLVTAAEGRKLVEGLKALAKALDQKRLEPDSACEDVHTAIHQALRSRVGKVADKLHTARSRNDQVNLDTRLYLKHELKEILVHAQNLQKALVSAARKSGDTVLPGYTHLQRAQPVLAAHHLLAYVEMLERDKGRLQDALKRVDVLPLGSGALAGTTLAIDREFMRKALGFAKLSENSMDAVSDRDFVLEVLADLSILGLHLSRFCEDGILWVSSEFGFAALDQAYCTGSSMMPQKQNPDSLELIRGMSGRLLGAFQSLAVTVKGLPLTYNRDLQWDKLPLFESVELSKNALQILAGVAKGLRWNREVLKEVCLDESLLATDVAEYLVSKGVAFADSHRVVGVLVSNSLEQGKSISSYSVKELQKFSRAFESDISKVLSVEGALRRRNQPGSTAPAKVRASLVRWEQRLRR
ncbi:MAG: argininosuccinate lyase [Candidatus Omnitrophica bacterium]|nr:argininosuccinate lyase [Candidatus Omnitrophota bacterium]